MVKIKRSVALICTLALMMITFAGCSGTNAKKTETYVTSVKTLVNDCVNNTRTLRTQNKQFDCTKSGETKAYISTLDTLLGLYRQILTLQSTDSYDDLDKKIKADAENTLSDITEIKSLASYALESGNDSLYKKDFDKLFNDYLKNYNDLTSLSSEVQTRYRNA